LTIKLPFKVNPLNVGESEVAKPNDALAVLPVSKTKLEPSPTIKPPSVTAKPDTSVSLALKACIFVPITRPRFDLAPEAVVAPVPPSVIPIKSEA
jgi:hypothetical protein